MRTGPEVAVVAFLLIGVTAGCRHHSPAETAEAQDALAAAWAACAPEYAAERFEAAQQAMGQVRGLLAAGERGQARSGSREAVRLAREAEEAARRLMSVARAAADRAMVEADEALDKARLAPGNGPAGAEVEAAAERLKQARMTASASHRNYRRARELAIEAKLLASNADSETVASLRR